MSEPTETVVVADANAAHKLIGRSIGGVEIGSVRLYDGGFRLSDGICTFITTHQPWGESVEVDALPPATMRVHLDDLPGHTLPGETEPVHGVSTIHGVWHWWTGRGISRHLTVVDHMVEVLAPVPVVEAPDEVTGAEGGTHTVERVS